MSRFCGTCGGGNSTSRGKQCSCKPTCSEGRPGPALVNIDNCDCNFTITEVFHRPGNYIFDIDGCCARLDIAAGVKALETVTHLTRDNSGNIVYINENGDRETVNIKDLLPHGDLEDLGNVDDNLGSGCAFLFKNAGSDIWESWKTDKFPLKSDETAAGVMVFTTGGCPRYLPAPESGVASLVAKDGVVQWDGFDVPSGVDPDDVHPAWGNINETHAVNNNGTWGPDREHGIWTHDPSQDECNDIIVA